MSHDHLDGPYGRALLAAGLVRAVAQPDDHGALVALARSGKPWMPLGAGRDGTLRPREPVVLAMTRSLAVRVSIDERSGIAKVSANARWVDVERHASEHGWTTEHLVDADPEATIGGTLGRRTLLPPLWLADTAVGACIGLEGVRSNGDRYTYREAPRTSSGPDFRAHWFGAEGGTGLITHVSLELARQAPTVWFEVPLASADWRVQRTWLDRYAGRATIAGGDGVALTWCIRGSGRVVDHACDTLSALGHAVLPPAGGPPAARVEVCVPWAAWDLVWKARAAASIRVDVGAAGPTHVLLRAQGRSAALVAWANRVAKGPLSRWSLRGALEPAAQDSVNTATGDHK